MTKHRSDKEKARKTKQRRIRRQKDRSVKSKTKQDPQVTVVSADELKTHDKKEESDSNVAYRVTLKEHMRRRKNHKIVLADSPEQVVLEMIHKDNEVTPTPGGNDSGDITPEGYSDVLLLYTSDIEL